MEGVVLALAPPQSEHALVVGKVRVPIRTLRLVDAQGNFKDIELVELGRTHGATELQHWLFGPLGFTWAQTKFGLPWKLPLFAELKETLHPLSLKRLRDGSYRDTEGPAAGHVRAQLLHMTIRGRCVRGYNSRRHLMLDLCTKADMDWLFLELFRDLQQRCAVAPGIVAPGIAPFGIAAPGMPCIPAPLTEAIELRLQELRKHRACKQANWDHRNGRVRVVPKTPNGNGKPMYFKAHSFKQQLVALDGAAPGASLEMLIENVEAIANQATQRLAAIEDE